MWDKNHDGYSEAAPKMAREGDAREFEDVGR